MKIEHKILQIAGVDGLSSDHPMLLAANDLILAKMEINDKPEGIDAKKFFNMIDAANREYDTYTRLCDKCKKTGFIRLSACCHNKSRGII